MTGDPLHVLVVHNYYRSEQPSGEDRVVDQDLALLAAAGHTVRAFFRRSDDIADMSLLDRALVPARVPWNGSVRKDLRRFLEDDRPDVVHVHCTFPLLSPSVVAACADVGVPLVATLHNYGQICPVGTLRRNGDDCRACSSGSAFAAVRHGCYRGSRIATVPVALGYTANRRLWWSGVDRFFCISAAQRDVLVAGGMPAGKLHVRPNSVPDTGPRRRDRGEHVLYLGRLTAEKGVRTLAAAWDRVAAAGGIGLPLVVAGSGPLDAELRSWAEGRADVRMAGLQDEAGSRALLASAATVVVPSEWLEAFGLVAAEAMAAGVPVVAAAHGALTEIVEDGLSGLLFPPGDAAALVRAMTTVVSDPGRNAEMGAAARRSYERRWAPDVGLDTLETGYRAVVAARSRIAIG